MAAAAAAIVLPTQATTTESAPVAERIIGGTNATENYGFYVKLFSGSSFLCGASLISPEWVVTAKHCVDARPTSVRVGGTTLNSGEQIQIASMDSTSPDFGIIKLAKASAQGTPIPITTNALATGQAVRIIGHGQTCPTRGCGSAPNNLQQLDTTLVNNSGCTASFQSAKELCVGDNTQRGACYGDSGGPLVVKVNGRWELGGATSRAGQNNPTCATAPSIYEKVPAFNAWIKSHTG
ncbi:serine protease [Pseudonocardiaceae bacterium YIM PH 21723]|nr:serine protease [Pseudonocardiaceae bacterium YIM PH 21723]